MPELPEVEVVRAGLEPAVRGALITGVEVFEPRSLKRHDRSAGDFISLLEGRSLLAAVRRGKFLWFPIAEPASVGPAMIWPVAGSGAARPGAVGSAVGTIAAGSFGSGNVGSGSVDSEAAAGNHPASAVAAAPVAATQFVAGPVAGNPADAVASGPSAGSVAAELFGDEPKIALVTHLGMSGQVLLRAPGAEESGRLRIRLGIEHPLHGELWVHFVDQRIFGSMAVDTLLPTPDGLAAGWGSDLALLPSQVAHISRDPLDPAFSEARFFESLGRTSSAIKRVLLNQTVISGVGNIYADESLWAARVHPEQPSKSLSAKQAEKLLAEVRTVLLKALAEGGTSFDAQYVNVNGASGYFSRSLHVYGRQGQPCDRCGTSIVRDSFMNRGSHFCPKCQRRT